jgi:hypothetical protein
MHLEKASAELVESEPLLATDVAEVGAELAVFGELEPQAAMGVAAASTAPAASSRAGRCDRVSWW